MFGIAKIMWKVLKVVGKVLLKVTKFVAAHPVVAAVGTLSVVAGAKVSAMPFWGAKVVGAVLAGFGLGMLVGGAAVWYQLGKIPLGKKIKPAVDKGGGLTGIFDVVGAMAGGWGYLLARDTFMG